METIITQYLITIGWGITGGVSMAISLSILVWAFSKVTPIDEWEEIKKGNMAVALVIAAVILGGAFVIGQTVMP
jgi:uncharacterized membrane protein YjfL (UPF0719 family)